VVGAGGVEFGGESGAANWGNFVSMEFERKAGCAGFFEIPARVFDSKNAFFAKDIYKVRQVVLLYPWENLFYKKG